MVSFLLNPYPCIAAIGSALAQETRLSSELVHVTRAPTARKSGSRLRARQRCSGQLTLPTARVAPVVSRLRTGLFCQRLP